DRCHCRHPHLVWTAPPLCPDMIFGKDTDPGRASSLLRARRERPGRRRAAEQRYERAAIHSITLSARNTREGGTSKPIAFAVLRLIANSNLVGCSTGTSLTFSLLKTLPSCRANCRNIWVMRGP